jgi:urease accessory protein
VGLSARAGAVAELRSGRTVLTEVRSQVPLRLRETCDGLTVVASAFGPLGGDRTRTDVTVRAGAGLVVGSAGAQVAQPGVGDAVSHAEVRLVVEAGAHLVWRPEPLVVTEGAEHRSVLVADVDPSATVVLTETVVLGRTAGRPGRARSSWRVRCAGRPLLSADLDVGPGAAAGWDGPAVTAGARVLVTALATGSCLPQDVAPPEGGEVLRLAGPGLLLSWLGHDPVAAARALTAFVTAARAPARPTGP